MWKRHHAPNHDFILNLSREFDRIANADPRQFPTLFGKTVLIVSDYSEGRKESNFYVVSLLIVDFDFSVAWDVRRRGIRSDQLGDSRRMSFKKLSDRRRGATLHAFLDSANEIPGILISFAVHKSLLNLFTARDDLRTTQDVFNLSAKWKLKSLQKLSLIVGFVTFCCGGLMHDDQDVLWVTDDDDFTASHHRMTDVIKVLRFYRMVNARTHTGEALFQKVSDLPNAQHSMLFEDLCSIPDLTAGTFSECISNMCRERELQISSEPVAFHLSGVSQKSKTILKWHEDRERALRRMLCVFTPDPDPAIAFRVLIPQGMTFET
jgi:hypothetical protein